jgi:plasmid stabilization system protein ParE
MAESDIKIIMEVLGSEDVERAGRVTEKLTKKVDSLGNQLRKGAIDNKQFRQGVQQIIKANAKHAGSYTALQSEVQRYSGTLQRKINEELRSVSTQEQVQRVVSQTTNTMRVHGNAVDEVRNQYVRMNAATFKSQQRIKRFASVGLQQAGYQIGDFIVQVQSGQSALVAFGQQGSQLAGIFGPAGAVIGALIAAATAVGMIVKSLNEANAKAKSLVENLEKANILRGVGGEIALAIANAKKELIEAENRINRIEAGIAARIQGQEGTSYEDELQRLLELERESNSELYESRDALVVRLRLLEAQKDAQEALVNDQAQEAENLRESQAYIQGIKNSSDAIAQTYKDILGSAEGLSKSEEALNAMYVDRYGTTEQLNAMLDASQKTGEALRATAEGISGALQAASGIDLKSVFTNALPVARELFSTAMAMATEDPLDAFGGYGEFKYGTPSKIKAPKPPKVSGSGVSAAEKQAQEFENARNALAGLVSQYDEGVERAERLRDAQNTVNEAINAGVISADQGQQVMSDYIDSLEDAKNPMADFVNNAAKQMSSAFMSIVDGSKSASDAFKDMARSILKQAFELAVINPIINSIFGGASGFTKLPTFANGAAFSNGKVTAFADGGVVNQPTIFPMANGAGLMGEAGPEAIMPLKRGKNGKLGVQVEDGSQGNVTVENHFHIAANGDDSVKRIIAQEAPKIANLTQKQILDQRRRGGVMKSTFG